MKSVSQNKIRQHLVSQDIDYVVGKKNNETRDRTSVRAPRRGRLPKKKNQDSVKDSI